MSGPSTRSKVLAVLVKTGSRDENAMEVDREEEETSRGGKCLRREYPNPTGLAAGEGAQQNENGGGVSSGTKLTLGSHAGYSIKWPKGWGRRREMFGRCELWLRKPWLRQMSSQKIWKSWRIRVVRPETSSPGTSEVSNPSGKGMYSDFGDSTAGEAGEPPGLSCSRADMLGGVGGFPTWSRKRDIEALAKNEVLPQLEDGLRRSGYHICPGPRGQLAIVKRRPRNPEEK